MNIDDFLKAQSAKTSRLLATLESVAEPQNVRITPVIPEGECGCAAALMVPKAVVRELFPTGEHRVCCGKHLQVVEIEFAAEGAVLASVFTQLTSRIRPARNGDPTGSPLRRGVGVIPRMQGDCQERCEDDLLACYDVCDFRGEPHPYGWCWQDCDVDYDKCLERCIWKPPIS